MCPVVSGYESAYRASGADVSRTGSVRHRSGGIRTRVSFCFASLFWLVVFVSMSKVVFRIAAAGVTDFATADGWAVSPFSDSLGVVMWGRVWPA